ncbi:hypothetical protein TcWFU_009766 [Taenia crassiceps]|uniref:Uncharacterized protein n=1 Tax=Taenia crassiceps TaxID=6207 RepID=A0ABR4Q456_9CEST
MLYDTQGPQNLKLPLLTTRTPSPPRRQRHLSPSTGPTTTTTTTSASKSACLVSAIRMGHTRCLRRYIFDLLNETSSQKTSSPKTNCGSSILDRRATPPRADYEWITARRQLHFNVQGGSCTIEFEQTSSPLIWAVDCREWSCLRLMCTIQAIEQEGLEDKEPTKETFHGAVYNPSQPQPVRRRVINCGTGRFTHSPSTSQTCVCCTPESSRRRSGELGLLQHEDIPVSLRQRLRPFANVMLSVSFSNLCNTRSSFNISNGNDACSSRTGSFLDIRSWKSAQSSPRRVVSPLNRSPHSTHTRGANSVVLLGCLNANEHSSRHRKRPTPYRAFWVRGSYTYQSVLDYFFATGYESVGTHCLPHQALPMDCEHCKQDADYSDYPNYPNGPLDPRNDIFFEHFSQLERMLQSSGVSANRLDSVMAFNALAISAGRRLAGWCCHGAEGDPTIGPDLEEPLIEWRILATLIDHGLDEFEWLEFLSPQQNFIGHALCVLAWPKHGWSRTEAAILSSYMSSNKPSSFSGFSSGDGNESKRLRRRSSSPLGRNGFGHPLPPAPLGTGLRRQACLLLINLWSLGAFTSHHIVHRRSCGAIGNAVSSSRIWDSRPGSQRSHSYTATMEGGDLRRIMLKTISTKSEQMGMEPLEFLRRWSYFHALWRSALSGTPLPEPLRDIGYPGVLSHQRRCSPTLPPCSTTSSLASSASSASSSSRNLRTYQPICLRLLTRRAVRGNVARAEMTRRHGASAALTPPLTVPALQRFLGYFHSLQHMLGAPLPAALQILLSTATSINGNNLTLRSSEDANSPTNCSSKDETL